MRPKGKAGSAPAGKLSEAARKPSQGRHLGAGQGTGIADRRDTTAMKEAMQRWRIFKRSLRTGVPTRSSAPKGRAGSTPYQKPASWIRPPKQILRRKGLGPQYRAELGPCATEAPPEPPLARSTTQHVLSVAPLNPPGHARVGAPRWVLGYAAAPACGVWVYR
jgi:hypothetical protein